MSSRLLGILGMLVLCGTLGFARKRDDEAKKHESGLANAPETAHGRLNPYEGKAGAVAAGRKLFERYCAECHGDDSRGRGNAPSLDSERVQRAPPGDLFWFLTNGNLRAGMPSWSRLPDAQRWQIVMYLKTLYTRSDRR